MGIQDYGVKQVIFAGPQFNQPFSHMPEWLEGAIESGNVRKMANGDWTINGIKIEKGTKMEWSEVHQKVAFVYVEMNGHEMWTVGDQGL